MMLAIPTSAATAILIGDPMSSYWPAVAYVVVTLLFVGVFCAWEMLLAAAVGRAPARSNWLVLAVGATCIALAGLAERLLTAPVDFNGGEMSTLWGFVLAPWLTLAALPFIVSLAALRIGDARGARPIAGVPAVAWWCAGCLIVAACGVVGLWADGQSPWSNTGTMPLYVAGYALAIGGAGALVAAVALRVLRRGRSATETGSGA
jgi:hypothetical protein